MQRTEDSWRSSLDFNFARPEYRWDSSVSIVTQLRAAQPPNNIFLYSQQLQEIIFIFKSFQASCAAHPAPTHWLSEALSTGGLNGRGVKSTMPVWCRG